MFFIEVDIKASPIHGAGVFTRVYIKKGDLVWKWQEGFDFYISLIDFVDFPEVAKVSLTHYCDVWNDCLCLYGDGAQFMNHSSQANVVCLSVDCDGSACYASRDIMVGEELTDDYQSRGTSVEGYN